MSEGETKSTDAPEAEVTERMPPSMVAWPLGWLIALALLWLKYRGTSHLEVFGLGDGVPTAALWFGALGGVASSLHGMFTYNSDWDPSFNLWHRCAPMMGAIYGVFSFLFILVVAKTATSGHVDTNGGIFAVGAFALGYSQKQFGLLLTKVFDTIFMPSDGGPKGS